MLRDRYQRSFGTLRLSVTDRCNFRCTYCMPEAGVALVPRAEILSFEEIARVVRVAAKLGFHQIRLTGGEPTVRKDLPRLIEMLSVMPGIDDIAMTTNAALLSELALPLKNAGLHRLNISLDTLRRDRAQTLSRRDLLPQVLGGIEAALNGGFAPLKFNAVILRGQNDDELCDLLEFAHRRGAVMRFIEWMPMGQTAHNAGNGLVTGREMRAILSQRFDLQPIERENFSDAARLWQCARTGAQVGFIESMSDHFCDSCNRMRLTAQGGLRPCLHQNAEVDLRAILRSGAEESVIEKDLEQGFAEAAALKWAGHHIKNVIPLYSLKDMVSIGG